MLVSYVAVVIIIAAFVAVFLLFRHVVSSRLLKKSLKLRLLLIKVPPQQFEQKPGEKPQDFKTEINLTEQLFNVLSNLKTPSVVEVAVHHIGEEIYFYVAATEESVDFAMREIHGLWPTASVEAAGDYNIFNPEGEVAAAYVKLQEPYMVPLRTYQEIESDTFAGIVSNLSKLEKVGEGAAIQLIIKRAPNSVTKSIYYAITQLKQGKKLKKKKKKKKVFDGAAVKLRKKNLPKPLFFVNIRLVASGPTKERARAL